MAVLRRALMALGLPMVLLVAWWAATRESESFYVPPLTEVLSVFGDTWFTGRLGDDVVPSLLRLAAGYTLAVIAGVGLGLAAGSSASLRSFLEPVLEFFRAIPPPVLIPVIILFAGIGDTMKIVVIAFGCVWPVLLNTIEGVRGTDEVLRDTAHSYRLGTATRLRHLGLRAASPQIAAGARQALAIAIILMVISEMYAANNGLGFSVVQFQRSFAIPEMWSGIILLGVLGVTLALLFRVVENQALGWYHGQRRAQRGG